MMIGRNLSFTASSVASIGDLPSASSSIANSTMRIAFFAARPMIVISPTLKYTSADKPRIIVKRTDPRPPNGTTTGKEIGKSERAYMRKRMVPEVQIAVCAGDDKTKKLKKE